MGYLAFVLTIVFSQVFRQKYRMVARAGFYRPERQLWTGERCADVSRRGRHGSERWVLFALELAPSVILSLRIIAVTEGLGGLRAAQQLMTPILRPLLGVPGICSLALIANLQNTDAAAG